MNLSDALTTYRGRCLSILGWTRKQERGLTAGTFSLFRGSVGCFELRGATQIEQIDLHEANE